MDLLSRFSSTISNKSKDVAKKAKELAEISNLNSQIDLQEEIIDKLCLEIGKTVYEKRDLFPDSALAEKYTAVTNAYAEIARLHSAIITAKGANQCPGCGIEVALGNAFCPSCGTAVPAPEPYVENIVIPPDSVIYYPNVDPKTSDRS